jgi:uncharacterized protein YqjF (DUF2071 family)
MHELNVRTYVHHNGVPGVWFFSLDTNSSAAALAARTVYHLPYYTAEIEIQTNGKKINYSLSREEEPAAEFEATWTVGEPLPLAQPGSREFFLTERYILYSEYEGELYRARVHHQPWPLRQASLVDFSSDLLEADGLPELKNEPLVHCADEVNVDIWFLERV